jgi:DNA repair exonuclease SbcCD nuclease subunit
MILIADLHLGISQDNELWHNASINLAKEIADVCIRNGENTISILGDVFDKRLVMNQKTHDVAWEILTDIWRDFSIILIRGNHDTYYKNQARPNWLRMFRDCYNITIVETEPYISGDCCWVPWKYDISTLDFNGYLFGHFEINNFKMNNAYECITSDISVNDFRKFKKVFAGHFHFPQTYRNVTYLGSPFHHDFGDVGSKRGYYIWNVSGELEFIEFTQAPQFIKIRTDIPITVNDVKGNVVKLIFDRDYGTNKNNKLVEQVEMFGPASLTIDTSNFNIKEEDKSPETDDIVIKNNDDILKEFMNKKLESLPHLNNKTLYKILDLLIKDIKDE